MKTIGFNGTEYYFGRVFDESVINWQNLKLGTAIEPPQRNCKITLVREK